MHIGPNSCQQEVFFWISATAQGQLLAPLIPVSQGSIVSVLICYLSHSILQEELTDSRSTIITLLLSRALQLSDVAASVQFCQASSFKHWRGGHYAMHSSESMMDACLPHTNRKTKPETRYGSSLAVIIGRQCWHKSKWNKQIAASLG